MNASSPSCLLQKKKNHLDSKNTTIKQGLVKNGREKEKDFLPTCKFCIPDKEYRIVVIKVVSCTEQMIRDEWFHKG